MAREVLLGRSSCGRSEHQQSASTRSVYSGNTVAKSRYWTQVGTFVVQLGGQFTTILADTV